MCLRYSRIRITGGLKGLNSPLNLFTATYEPTPSNPGREQPARRDHDGGLASTTPASNPNLKGHASLTDFVRTAVVARKPLPYARARTAAERIFLELADYRSRLLSASAWPYRSSSSGHFP